MSNKIDLSIYKKIYNISNVKYISLTHDDLNIKLNTILLDIKNIISNNDELYNIKICSNQHINIYGLKENNFSYTKICNNKTICVDEIKYFFLYNINFKKNCKLILEFSKQSENINSDNMNSDNINFDLNIQNYIVNTNNLFNFDVYQLYNNINNLDESIELINNTDDLYIIYDDIRTQFFSLKNENDKLIKNSNNILNDKYKLLNMRKFDKVINEIKILNIKNKNNILNKIYAKNNYNNKMLYNNKNNYNKVINQFNNKIKLIKYKKKYKQMIKHKNKLIKNKNYVINMLKSLNNNVEKYNNNNVLNLLDFIEDKNKKIKEYENLLFKKRCKIFDLHCNNHKYLDKFINIKYKISSLQNKINNIKEENVKIKDENIKLKDENTELKDENTELKNKIKEYNINFKNFQKKYDILNDVHENLLDYNNSLYRNYTETLDINEDLESDIKKYKLFYNENNKPLPQIIENKIGKYM